MIRYCYHTVFHTYYMWHLFWDKPIYVIGNTLSEACTVILFYDTKIIK